MTIEIENEVVEETNPVFTFARKMLQAGMGAATTLQNEFEEITKNLIERGESVEKDGRKYFDDFVTKSKDNVNDQVKKAEKQFEDQVEAVLHRLNIPTKKDIDSLNRKITNLTKKVNELKKANES
jgi:poly(hydroxyalkanoate) granule-associated protein